MLVTPDVLGFWRGFCFRPGILTTVGHRQKPEKGSLFSAPNSGTTLVEQILAHDGKNSIFVNICLVFWAMPPVRLGLSGRIPEKFRKDPGNALRAFSWNFPREYGWDAPNPIIQGILRAPEHFQNYLPPSTAGDVSFFRSGSGEGLSEPVMEFPAVLGVFA